MNFEFKSGASHEPEFCKEWPWAKTFKLLEFMAGFGNLTKQFLAAGLEAFAYEIKRCLTADLSGIPLNSWASIVEILAKQ